MLLNFSDWMGTGIQTRQCNYSCIKRGSLHFTTFLLLRMSPKIATNYFQASISFFIDLYLGWCIECHWRPLKALRDSFVTLSFWRTLVEGDKNIRRHFDWTVEAKKEVMLEDDIMKWGPPMTGGSVSLSVSLSLSLFLSLSLSPSLICWPISVEPFLQSGPLRRFPAFFRRMPLPVEWLMNNKTLKWVILSNKSLSSNSQVFFLFAPRLFFFHLGSSFRGSRKSGDSKFKFGAV